ncbi:Endonuclease/exonuclease/phosphatase [Rhodococcus sp. RD6.2]|nr:Endonuclease/exonuclease/phosphatase [Rhodococcus sp. RD6.2]
MPYSRHHENRPAPWILETEPHTSAAGDADPRGVHMITVATWNVENLYRPGTVFGPLNDEIYRRKLDVLADTVTEIDVDILAVQEVGDPDALADLVDLLPGRWHHRLSAYPDARGIRVGFVSRLSFLDGVDIVDLPAPLCPVRTADSPAGGSAMRRMGRGALQVHTETEIGTVHLINAHLKSKLLTFPGNRFAPRDEDERARFGAYALHRRAVEASTVRIAATAALGESTDDLSPALPPAVIVLGDLNDTADAATTLMLEGPPGSRIGTSGPDSPRRDEGVRLWNVAPLIPSEHRYSRISEGRYELIDHILISRRLLDHMHSAAAVTAGVDDISADPTCRRGATASDHAPVVARFL